MSDDINEPWSIEYMGCDESDVRDADGVSIISAGGIGYMSDSDARRIVACVNSCAGISTEALESGKKWADKVTEWQPIETAPKDGTVIIAWCNHSADPYFLQDGKRLTPYGANAEGMSHAEDGVNLVYWHDAFNEIEYTIPAWWCVSDGTGEIAANPTHWMPLPSTPEK